MTASLDKTWQFLERLQRAVDARDVEAILADIIRPFGLTSILAGLVPKDVPLDQLSRSERAESILLQRLPPLWAKRYFDANYLSRDPVVLRFLSDQTPFTWDEAFRTSPSSDDARLIGGEAAEFGLRSGFVVPVALLDGSLTVMSFGGEAPELSPEDRSMIAFVSSCAIGQLLQLRRDRQAARGTLSPREHDCLKWAAQGKSEWAIAQILCISRSTVTKHLSSARHKLGALTRSHAVAIAFRDKLIR